MIRFIVDKDHSDCWEAVLGKEWKWRDQWEVGEG